MNMEDLQRFQISNLPSKKKSSNGWGEQFKNYINIGYRNCPPQKRGINAFMIINAHQGGSRKNKGRAT